MRKRSLATNSGLAFAGDLSSKLGLLLVMVIAARVLPTDELAILGTALAVSGILAVCLDCGSGLAITRDGARDAGTRGALLSALVVARLPAVALVIVAGVAAGIALDAPVVWIGAALLAVLGALAVSLIGYFRAGQDMQPEAVQKLVFSVLALGLTGAAVAASATADAVLLALVWATVLSLASFLLVGRRTGQRVHVARWRALQRAVPLGLMAIATVIYYRSGTVGLALLSTPEETASYTVAAAVGFGLLMLPNAITTGLLPHLSAAPDGGSPASTRRALRWSLTLSTPAAAAFALGGYVLLGPVFGAQYADAALPLAILCAAVVVIAYNGILGTALLAAGHVGIIVLQVACSLVVNLVALAALAPALGAPGAATATLLCELVAAAMLTVASARRLPGINLAPESRRPHHVMIDVHASTQPSVELYNQMRRARRVHALPGVVVLLLAGLVALQLWARSTDYGLRVTSDTPTFLALIPDMADRPFERQSPFLADDEIATPHAEPYTQALAFLWHAVRASDEERDPVALGRMLSLVGIGVMFFVLFAVFAYARSVVGRREAWIAVPALLALFGPANVIWASDLSLHGFLYAAWFPQNVAIGLLLFTLLALDWRRRAGMPVAILLAATTMTIHPFTGVLLTLLVTVRGCQLAVQHDGRWRRASYTLVGGFALGSLWPAYSLSHAMSETGLSGGLFVALAAATPLLAWVLAGSWPVRRAIALGGAIVRGLSSRSKAHWLAVGGFLIVLALGFWAAALAHRPPSDPLITTNRLSIYWVEDRWRWPLMLAAGAVGIYGLARLARRGCIVPALWFAGCFTLGTIGAFGSLAGLEIPIWYRFLLAAQIPLAVGIAAAIPGLPRNTTRYVASAAGFAIAFKTLTLVGLPPTHTYFRTGVQDAYRLGEVLPPGETGLVATDPRTAYFIPGATGRRVLTVTKAHVGSPRELAAAERGYAVLHEFWAGGPTWWQAAQRMWVMGVRWVVVEKSTLIAAPNLERFSTGPSPLVHPGAEREQLGNYFYENNRLGTLLYDSDSYAVYRLDPTKLFVDSRHAWGVS